MASEKSSKGNQIVQTVLVVVVSVLLTAVLVLFLKKGVADRSAKEGETDTKVAVSDEETDRDIIDRMMRDSQSLSERLSKKDAALNKAINDKSLAESARNGITDQMVTVRAENNQLAAKLSEAGSALAKLKSAEFEVQSLKKYSQSLQLELQKAKANNSTESLTAANTLLEHSVADLRGKLNFAKAELEKLKLSQSDDQTGALKAEVIALNTNNKELRARLVALQSKLNRSTLFVKEASQLSPKAAVLYQSLKALKVAQGPQLNLAYTALEKKLNVVKVRQVKFAEGSAFIPDHEEGLIRDDLKGSGEKSYFLVVGYASKVGTPAINSEISAKRATSTASVVQKLKAEGQQVRAVYLGQTDRFSSQNPTANQVCEIWEIKQ